jgi:AcrR family transcriptional regulator
MSMNMPKTIDLRVRRTHKLLWEALLVLIERTGFETITVQQICDQAMVHRTTFYKHYEDKYDLLQRGILGLFAELTIQMESPEKVVARQDSHHPPEHFIRIFQHASTNHRLYKTLLANGGVETFRKLLYNFMTEQITQRIHLLTPHKQRIGIPQEVTVQFAVGALLNVLTAWIMNDLPHPPQQMATWVHELISIGIVNNIVKP